jgi:hypothetical protein
MGSGTFSGLLLALRGTFGLEKVCTVGTTNFGAGWGESDSTRTIFGGVDCSDWMRSTCELAEPATE